MTAIPKKEVIYVDIDDDITSIIEKIKDAPAPIVALVPPKRIGALQSVVNLKLLQRAAEAAKKRVVMITNDHALTALAAGVAMPVAKNLQSKPEVADLPTDDDQNDDVIDGAELPAAAAASTGAVGDELLDITTPLEETSAAADGEPVRKKRSGIPNFDRFRNNLFLYVGGALLVVTFLVWALFFAPHASVTITAKTTPYSVNKALVASPTAELAADKGSIKATVKEIKKTVSADFTATGKKDVGEKSTGSVKYTNSSPDAVTLDAGDKLTTSGGLVFVVASSTTIPGAKLSFGCPGYLCAGSATGSVTAAEPGTKYNAASGSLSGAPSSVTATLAGPTAGGTDKTITVVSEEDAAKARDSLKTDNADTVKEELKKQFTGDSIIVAESFSATPGNPAVAPAVGQEATTGKVSVETTYRMIGVARSDVRAVVEKDVQKQIAGLPNQSIYDLGIDAVRFNTYIQSGDTYGFNVQTTTYVGPSVDSTTLARKLTGKREGEIQQIIKTYEGIRSVDVKFSPFWVMTAPSPDKITIKFQIENAGH